MEVAEIKGLMAYSKHFCVLPWIHFHAWPNGNVMPCCVADSTMPVSTIKKDESIIQMMNSEEYKKMRVAMLNDEPVEACRRCYDLELMGTYTMRKSHNYYTKHADVVHEFTKADGSLTDFKMTYMDIRFSNMCNMKCRSCGPACSSLWAQEIVDRHGVEHYEKYFHVKNVVNSNNDDGSFMTKLKPYLKDVTEVYFAGGEIIITPEHYSCLDYWVDNGLTSQVELTYTTNLGSLKYKDRDLINYWKKFPKLKIWASLDGSGAHAEVIRKGSDWERIVRNIKQIKQLVPHAEFQITPTLSLWNVFSFPEFLDSLIETGLIDGNSSPRFNTASHPWFANMMLLPDFVKDKLIEKYGKYIEKYSYNTGITNGFMVIQQTLKSGHAAYGDKISYENKGGMLEFKKYNDEIDAHRGEKLTDVIPELIEVYKWAEK